MSISKSSFHGRLNEIPGIAVDNFEGENIKSRAFFLSHCHTDHTQGLFSEDLINSLKCNTFIYMSKLTAAVIADGCSDRTLMSYIKPLELGTTDITLPSLYGHDEVYITVSLISAGHCLGSVMFLFETSNKIILYTGDFNLSVNDISKYKYLHTDDKEPIKIDAMYIDTTFITYEYEYFPKRSEVTENLISIIRNWLNISDKNAVALSVSAKYGYESVYNEIHKAIGFKVFVNEDRWKFYSAHQNIAHGITNNEKETRIHVCRYTKEVTEHKFCNLHHTKDCNFLFIRFSAMRWDKYELETTAIKRCNNRVDVCFATHCSRSQIFSFVNYFSPSKVVGFPNDFPLKPKEIILPQKRKLPIEKLDKRIQTGKNI